jgi:hypothetical protein
MRIRVISDVALVTFGVALGAALALAGISQRQAHILHASCVGRVLESQPNACVIYTHKDQCVSWPERPNGSCFIEDRPAAKPQ